MLIFLPAGLITWILLFTGVTGSEKVITTWPGAAATTDPCAGTVRTSAACAWAGPAGTSSTSSTPSSTPPPSRFTRPPGRYRARHPDRLR